MLSSALLPWKRSKHLHIWGILIHQEPRVSSKAQTSTSSLISTPPTTSMTPLYTSKKHCRQKLSRYCTCSRQQSYGRRLLCRNTGLKVSRKLLTNSSKEAKSRLQSHSWQVPGPQIPDKAFSSPSRPIFNGGYRATQNTIQTQLLGFSLTRRRTTATMISSLQHPRLF